MNIAPAEAAAMARDWRIAAREPGIDPQEIHARLERAAACQALAACGVHGHSDRTEEAA